MRIFNNGDILAALSTLHPAEKCDRCGREFGAEPIALRLYPLSVGITFGSFHEACGEAMPSGGAEEAKFLAEFEREAIAKVAPVGRA